MGFSVKDKVMKFAEEQHESINKFTVVNIEEGEKYEIKGETVTIGKQEFLKKRIDILPVIIDEKGEQYYEMQYFIHQVKRQDGKNNRAICMQKTFGKECPICKQIEEDKRNGVTYEEFKEKLPKQRALYAIIDLSDPDSIKILDSSYYLFGKKLFAEINSQGTDDEDVYEFADIANGMTLHCNFVMEKFNGNKFFSLDRIDFKKRKIPYTKDIIKNIPNLFERVIQRTPSEVEELFNFIPKDSVEENIMPEKPILPKMDTLDEMGEIGGYDDDEEVKVKKTSKEGPNLPKMDTLDKMGEIGGYDDDKEVKVKKTSKECPNNHVFGADCDEYDDCESCELWTACYKNRPKK